MKEKSNQVMLVATDGRRLAQIQRKASKKSGIAAEVIIPTKAALQMERMASDTGLMRLHVDDRHLYAKTAEAEMVAQLIDGVFPNFRDAIPKDVDKKVDIAADALASAVRRASLLRDPHGDTPSVTFRLHDNRLTLSSAAPNAGDAKIELEVAYGGPEVSIVLNPDYLTEGLKSLGANVITMEIADAATPCLMRYGKDYLYLTMPIT
jgi:DNA polymerase-3 subunit beta